MASKILSPLALLPFLLVISSSVSSLALHSNSSGKVSLELYYESLCPASRDFIFNHLPAIFSNGLISIVDLHFSPWGNTKTLSNQTFACQHGENECLLNTIEACVIDAWPDVDTHFHFLWCASDDRNTEWETCFDILGLPRKQIDLCYSSGRGKKLVTGYAQETSTLNPSHQYVPWVVVNGRPLYEDYLNFWSYICDAYRGTPKPGICYADLPGVRNVHASYRENFSTTRKLDSRKDDAIVKAQMDYNCYIFMAMRIVKTGFKSSL